MSFKEIKELRQAGKLEEALQMANQALETDPDNIWNKRAIAWVYYDYIKKFAHPESYDLFKENLIKIKDLQLPEDEKMLFDNCAWQIGRMVFGLQKAEYVDYDKINELFEIIRDFHFTKPSEAYSFIYKAFHKGYQTWSRYMSFAEWWNFENLRSEDYLEEEFNGKKLMSIAEQAYIAYSKKLLEGEMSDPFRQQRVVDKEKIELFLPKLDTIIEDHPKYQYPPYFKAKLLLAIGSEENVLSAFLPFARQKANNFWVWELMAEIFSEDPEIQFACYCKGLSLNTPEEYLVNLRLKFAGILRGRSMYNEAKTEINNIIATKNNKGWDLGIKISNWMEQDWYKNAEEYSNNQDLYLEHTIKAENILYNDLPEEIVAVEFVDRNRKTINFVENQHKYGKFKYSNFLKNPKIGDLLAVRFNGAGRDGFYKIYTAKKLDKKVDSEAVKDFMGSVELKSQGFGFVDGVFISPNMIKVHKLSDSDFVYGRAILSFNKSRNEWSWKAFELDYETDLSKGKKYAGSL